MFFRTEDFVSDLGVVRGRYQELKDAPRVADAQRFPERVHVNRVLEHNRAFRKYLSGMAELHLDRAAFYGAVIRETDGCFAAWDQARDARCEFYYIPMRRQALLKLR